MCFDLVDVGRDGGGECMGARLATSAHRLALRKAGWLVHCYIHLHVSALLSGCYPPRVSLILTDLGFPLDLVCELGLVVFLTPYTFADLHMHIGVCQ